MMVKIRLRRVGAKKQPSYRIVVADAQSPRDGRFIEVIGFYNPRTEPETVMIREERALHWLSVGAQPTEAVRRLLKNWGTLARFERLKQGESLETLAAEAESVSDDTIEAAAVAEEELTEEIEEEEGEEVEGTEGTE
ncbi:MAG TPA: 30S ribosomal protein S16 [Chloroflexi bacterium]|nr:30S ribosomal protein S16 [Chloroflexota bacterium]